MNNTRKSPGVIAILLTAAIGATVTVLLLPSPYAYSSVAVWAVAAGVFSASRRHSASSPAGPRVAEVSAAELAGFQRDALARGLPVITRGPVDDVLDPDGQHYLVLRKIKPSKSAGESPVAQCYALFRLPTGELRCAALGVDTDAFSALPKIEDRHQAEQVIKSYSRAPAYRA